MADKIARTVSKSLIRRRLRRVGQLAYLATIQALVGLVWLLLGAYLTVNSPSMAAVASRVVSEILPGSLRVQFLHVGPVLADGELRVRLQTRGLEMREPGGAVLIAAERAEVDMAPARLIDGLRAGALRLTLPRVVLDKPLLQLDIDQLGRLRLNSIFVDPNEPPKPNPKPLPVYVRLGKTVVTDGRYIMDLPSMSIDSRGIYFDSPGAAVTIEPGRPEPVDVQFDARHIVAAYAQTTIDSMRRLPAIPPGSLQAESAVGDLREMVVTGVSCQMPPATLEQPLQEPITSLSRARVVVQLQPEIMVHGDRLLLTTSSKSSFIRDMLGRLFDAEAQATGQFHFDPNVGFWTECHILGRGLMSGFHAEAVRGEVRVETGPPGDSLVRVITRNIGIAAYGGHIRSERVDYRMDLERPEHITRGIFAIDHVRGDAPLLDEAIKLGGITPLLASGYITGTLGTYTRTHLPDGQPLDLDVALDADLDLVRDAPLKMIAQKLPRVLWRGGLRFGMGPQVGMFVDFIDSELRTEDAEQSGAQTAALHCDGRLDLSGDTTNLRADLAIPQLEDWLAPLGIADVAGAVRLEGGRIEGALLRPGVLGRVSVDDLAAYGYKVRHGTAMLGIRGGEVALTGLRASTDIGDVSGDLRMGLFGASLGELAAERPLRIDHLTVRQVDLGKLLARWRVAGITGQGDLSGGQLSADLGHFMPSLRFSGDVALQGVHAYGEWFDRGGGHVEQHGLVTVLPNARLRLRGSPVDGSADIQTVGRFDLATKRLDIDVALPETRFKQFSWLENLPMPGTVAATIKLSGDGKDLSLAAGVDIKGLGWDAIELGSAHLDLEKAPLGPLLLKSDHFFESFKLLSGSEVNFKGWLPTTSTLRIGTENPLDPFERLGLPRPQGIAVRVEGEVAVEMALQNSKFDWRVETIVPAAGLWLDPGGGARPIRNTKAAVIGISADKITLGGTYFELNRSGIEVCGEWRYPHDDEPAALLGFVAGTFDIQRFGALSQSLSDLDLRLNVLRDPVVAADPRANCLEAAAAGGGMLRVDGPLDRLHVQALLETETGRVALRRFGHDITIQDGARLQIATSPRGVMTVAIPLDHELKGQVDDGHFTVSGRASLVDLQLDSVYARLWAGDIPYAVPKEYQMLISPDLVLSGNRLRDLANRDLRLAGDVHIGEGSYYRSFDQISSVLGNAGDRKVETYSKPITETMPWLAELGLDLKVHGKNFEVASRVPGGKADLVTEFDMRVSGNLSNLQVHDRLRVVEGSGSQISASLNNLIFEVVSGTLDFNGDATKPYLEAMARTDIPVRAGTRTGTMASTLGTDLTTDANQLDEIVQVFVQVKGVFGDRRNFTFHLTSNKGDTEADCMCLIAARRRCNDQGTGGTRLTTDFFFGEALNTVVTGLLKSVVDTVQIDFDPVNLGVSADVTKKLGKSIALGTRVQTGKENRYNANFSFRITDRLSLNGLWRRQKLLDSSSSQETSVDVYESKLRYKVPLSDE